MLNYKCPEVQRIYKEKLSKKTWLARNVTLSVLKYVFIGP